MRATRSLLAFVAVAAAAALAPVTASAVTCSPTTLTDSDGVDWQTSQYLSASTTNRTALAYASPYFDDDYAVYYYAGAELADRCSLEDGDRELRFPALMLGDLEVSGTVYVPSGPPAFMRVLVLLHNPHGEPAALAPRMYGNFAWPKPDSAMVTSSNGDAEATAADDWLVAHNAADATDPALALLWNFGTDRRRSANGVFDYDDRFVNPPPAFTSGHNEPQARFDRTVVPAGGTVAYMWAALTRAGDEATTTAARELQAAPDALLAGLSDEEKRMLQNVGLADADVDGIAAGDNCRFAVNPDQANLDGDAQGDACDDDGDGDGVADATEAARGTDPRKADTDGDGRRDDVDTCPLKAGSGPDGCARSDAPPLAPDTTKPGFTIEGVKKSMKRKAFLRGVPCVIVLDEAAAVTCRLLARATRVARLAKAGELELASRSLALGAGRRSARLKPRRSLIRQRRFRATLQVTATDAAGNRTTKAQTFRVK
ncbi:MAG TPA: thrombospondin type 3 repeat-containing protein [Solirubrobacteraceae bacterium]|jgi:hypothetical protein